ncbi:ArsI/CadI family heavy metal resistance metalloenzyme [Uliginosibacterium sp. H1]|uniref:ArsI/CadI family heavy metal resistance metalloenzyme n=1 Tax=Uliginosibacterium sp. H1 TaxID=3114757 RepID=UPI002E172556|nr:ArsI/CadI family heavy metal resistance metalloenzyme [Uliginosibacterium sp. H1]
MKRLHIHIAVADLAHNVDFYSRLFAQAPTVQHADYAKWMLDEPRINFAISARGAKPGLDHLGIQVDGAEELDALQARFEAADLATRSQQGTGCCYSRSDKHWVTDPQGVAWEHFHTLGDIPTFNDVVGGSANSGGCTPPVRGKPLGIPVKPAAPPATSCC